LAQATGSQWERITRIVPARDYHQNRYAALLERVVRPGDRWLDLGAGTQIHGGWLGESQDELRRRASTMLGCDLVKDQLVRNQYLGARYVATGEHLPLADASLDLVTANMVVEHLPQPETVFAEVLRVLRPGGHFVFVTPNRTHPVVFIASLVLHPTFRRVLAQIVERRKKEHIFLTHYQANTRRAVRRLAAMAGFTVEEVQAFSSLPFLGRWRLGLALEAGLIRVARLEAFAFLRSNLLVCLQRPQ
jgi:ubiquinone/menaquinone biosynthesis C-methylase UbiE